MMGAAKTSAWRLLPAVLTGWLVVVAAVNGTMVYDALHTFPGEAGGNAFDVSNHYDAVLQAAAREAQLGWTVSTTLEQGVPRVRIAAAGGVPLAGASVTGVARRPVGPEQRTQLALHAAPDGGFAGDARLPGAGRWDISLLVSAGGHTLHLTRRVTVQ